MRKTTLQISTGALEHNARTLRAALPEKVRMMAVVKADAYGHGALEVSRLLESLGADYLAVSCLDEALELRRGGICTPMRFQPPSTLSSMMTLKAVASSASAGPARSSLPKGAPNTPMA